MPRDKFDLLSSIFREAGSALVAFSSGVDSALLLYAAHAALGERAVAATVCSDAFPESEAKESKEFCRRLGIRHEIVNVDIFAVPEFSANGSERCYHCKRHIFSGLIKLAERLNLAIVAEGSNVDDDSDFRPGLKAIAELGVRSPLREAGLSKAEIRELSREFALPAWNKPSSACLASRFPYGEALTAEGLRRVELAERFLSETMDGLRQLRVRSHGEIARIEVPPEMIPATAEKAGQIADAFSRMGFSYTTLDFKGYRTGSMNEPLLKRKP
jgi:uncharacterized protein